MNRPASSKFVPGLPADDDIDTQTNSSNDNSIKIYDGVADCAMNDADTIKNVKIRAKDLAQENLIKKVADYVDGFLRDRLLTFPDDEILSIANEIYHITDVKYDVFNSDDNLMIRATVLAQIDDNDIMNCLVRFFNERIEFKHQIEDLKRQIISKDKIALSNQKSEEAYLLLCRTGSDYEVVIKLCDEAIQINPNNCDAYFSRGIAYRNLGQYERAIQDFTKVIELNPKKWNAYSSRGDAYKELRQYELAIQDYDKTIEFQINNGFTYLNRGLCYEQIGENAKAQADLAKAKKLGYSR